MLKHCLALCLALVASDVYGQTICNTSPTPPAIQRLPFQIQRDIPPQPAGSGTARTTKEKLHDLLIVPRFQFVVIDSVAIKGTQPAGAYLALELRTTALNEFGRPDWARHFLYAQDGSPTSGTALHVRESLRLYAASTSRVQLGIQSSVATPLERFVVTLTGEFVDCRLWGR